MRLRRRPRHQQRLFALALLTALPATGVALALLWMGDYSPQLRWTIAGALLAVWLGTAAAVRAQVVRPLQTLSNLLAALREGDFSIRARGARPDDALGLALMEVNALSRTLRDQRLGVLEATALLRAVISEIEVAVFAFDAERRLRLVNRAGERLLGAPAKRLLGGEAGALGLAEFLEGETPRTFPHAFPGRGGRWQLRRTTFRQGGNPHLLVVLEDVGQALREEERQAWQRLVRVLGHEINNSLAPIHSIAETLTRRLPPAEPGDAGGDLREGLAVIAARSAAMARFLDSYARLARLPPPRPRPVDVGAWVRRVAQLERRVRVSVAEGPACTVEADGDQLEQLLINLVRNAADAAEETGGGVEVRWTRAGERVAIWVEDEGPGLGGTENLFVPFFTTKPEGTGIGLALSRQIAEAHGGTLTLENRGDVTGCRAQLLLPLRFRGAEGGGPTGTRDDDGEESGR